MNYNEQYFIDLLSAFVNETEITAKPSVDWEEIHRLSKLHSVSGIVGYMADRLPKDNNPGESIAEKLSHEYYGTIIASAKKDFAMQNLMMEFEKAEIPLVIMKGFVVKDYYPVKELRTFGDIDLLIKKDDRQKTHALMMQLGFTARVDYGEVWEYIRDDEYYEIHTQIVSEYIAPNAAGVEYFNKAWDNVVIVDGSYIYNFTPEYHLLYILQHIAKHINGNGAGIRMFMDIAVYLNYFSNLKWDYILQGLEKLNLRQFADNVFALCHRWFCMESPFETMDLDSVFYDEMCDYVLSAGTFGFYGRNHSAFIVRREITNSKHKHAKGVAKIKALRSFFFPAYSVIKISYTFIEGKPYLLPVAWFVRAFKVMTPKRGPVANRIGEMMSGADEALEQYDLLSKLGLTECNRKQ